MILPIQFIANKTQSHNNDLSWLYELVLPYQVILLLASCSPAELASSSDYIANKQIHFEMSLFCKMMLTTEGGALRKTQVKTYFQIQSPFSFFEQASNRNSGLGPIIKGLIVFKNVNDVKLYQLN